MSRQPWRFLLILLSLLLTSYLGIGKSSAQSAVAASLSAPDISNFPHLTTYLDVHDADGGFIHGITAQDVTIQENEKSIPVSTLEEIKPGVQFVLAIMPGASFSIRDGMGISRYESFLQDLLAGTWMDQPPGVDDFSLLTMDGPQLTHSANPAYLLSALKSYRLEDVDEAPNLEVLSGALQVAADPTPRPGMERAILFITPPQESDISLGLQSIIASASQENIHISVWVLAAPEVMDSPQINQLRTLADQTGGTFFTFSHDETVPDLETLLEPLRYVYQLGYDSQVTAAGPQQLAAQVTVGSNVVTTTAQTFNVDLLSPAPTIIDPPSQVSREFATEPGDGTPAVTEVLTPTELILKLQISFPDGYERPITSTRLYIDGAMVAENSSPPFDELVWDLQKYTQGGVHTLSVEATDSLGLVGKTREIPVKIIVPSATQGVVIAITHNQPLLIGAGVVVLAAIAVLVLILGGRIRPKPHPGQVIKFTRVGLKTFPAGYRPRISRRKELADQTEQVASAPVKRDDRKKRNWMSFLPWLKRGQEPNPALAVLIPLVGFDEPTIPVPLQITSEEVYLGSDPHNADLVIADPSINGVHACIQKSGDVFVISDNGSGSGTWVNYEQVMAPGKPLAHMDIIHLGQVGFRFKSSEPGPLRKVVVTPIGLEDGSPQGSGK